MNKPLTIVFCIPGNSFSGRFLECWTNTVHFCFKNNIQPVLSRHESCNIYYVRNMCLGADVSRGKDQKPFDGKLDYDYLMWIDSDIAWDPRLIGTLVSHEKDIIAGIYAMSGGQCIATCKDWDEDFFKKNGYFQFLNLKDVEGKSGLIEVSYTGFGFMLIKKGVFENMEYPWFRPVMKQIGNAVDFCMEDVGFCLTAKERGYKIFIDPQVRVGHEKKVVL